MWEATDMRIILTNFFKRYNPPIGKRETIRLEQETPQLLCVVTIPERRFQACEISQILARSNPSSAEKHIWGMINDDELVSRPSWSASLCKRKKGVKEYRRNLGWEDGIGAETVRCIRYLSLPGPFFLVGYWRTSVNHPDMKSWIFWL